MTPLLVFAAISATCAAQATDETERWRSLDASKVRIENQVRDCLRIEPREVKMDGLAARLVADVKPLKSTAECGCRSTLLSYQVFERISPDFERVWMSGILNGREGRFGPERPLDLVLTSDATIPFREKVTVAIGCALDP